MYLTTDRLILREFEESDWRAVLAYQADPEYLRYYQWSERTAKDVRTFVHRFIASQKDKPRTKYQLAVVLAEEEHLIGTCCIRLETADARVGELGYETAPSYWDLGYATEAADTMLTFAFRELRVHRVWASCLLENVTSVRVLEKLGLRQEGKLRDSRWMKGRWWDTVLYGILEDEWETSAGWVGQ